MESILPNGNKISNSGWITTDCYFWQKFKARKNIKKWVDSTVERLEKEHNNGFMITTLVINKM